MTTTKMSFPSLWERDHECPTGFLWYTCQQNNFAGCCGVDPCGLPNCPSMTAASTTSTDTSSETKSSETSSASSSTSTNASSTTSTSASSSTTGSSVSTNTSQTSATPAQTSKLTAATSAAPSAQPGSSGHSKLSVSALIGLVVGVVVVGIIAAIWLCMLWGRHQRRKDEERAARRDGEKADATQNVGEAATDSRQRARSRQGPFDEFGGRYDRPEDRSLYNREHDPRSSNVHDDSIMSGHSELVSPLSQDNSKFAEIPVIAQLDSNQVYPEYEMDATPASRPNTAELDSRERPSSAASHPASLIPGPHGRGHGQRAYHRSTASNPGPTTLQVPSTMHLHGPRGETITLEAPRANLNATAHEQQNGIPVNNWSKY